MSGFPVPDPTQQPQGAPLQPQQPQGSPPLSGLQQRLAGIINTPLQPVPQVGPQQKNSVKGFLTNFFYGMGQASLQHVGLPTDYQRQQAVIAQNDRQRQTSAQAAEISSLIGLHQEQQADDQAKAQQATEDAKVIPVGPTFGKLFGMDPSTQMPQGMIREALFKHLTTAPAQHAPLSTAQGFFNVGPDGHATPIVGPDNQPLMPSKQEKPDTPEQQYIDEYQRTHPGATIAQALRGYTNTTQKVPMPTPITVVVTQPDGSGKVVSARPGQTIAPGAQSVADFGKRSGIYDKLVQPFDTAIASGEDAHRYAAMQNGTGDAALVLRYADAIKPDKGFRLTNTELGMFVHSRSALGNADALLNKVQSGALLTQSQRQDMLNIIDMKSNHAKTIRDSLASKFGQPMGESQPTQSSTPANGSRPAWDLGK